MAILAATPLTIHFFFQGHLKLFLKTFEVTLISNKKNDAYLPPLQLPIHEVSVDIARKISIFQDIKALYQLIILFRKNSFDIFFSVAPKAGFLGMLAAYVSRIPKRVHIFQGEVWASKSGPQRWLLKIADRTTAFLATELLAVSNSEKLYLEKEKIAPAGKIQVLGDGSICGVDTERFRPNSVIRDEIRKKLAIPLASTVIIFIGRMVRDKGLTELVDAFEAIATTRPNCFLLFVGPDEDGYAAQALEKLHQFRQQYCVVGYSNEIEKYLAAADLICLPSYREGFPVVILEAAAMEVPAVGTEIYGISDAILDRETGLLCKVKNVPSLIQSLEEIVDDELFRHSLGSAARARVQDKYISTVVQSRYQSFFQDLFK